MANPFRHSNLCSSNAPSFPVSNIKRTLDAMSWVKINHFHWHVVDSQSFALVIPGFEELAQEGAYSAERVYTPMDVEDIVSYAASVCLSSTFPSNLSLILSQRGIDVMVEIDTPGHSSAIFRSHPEHIACPEATPWAQFAGGTFQSSKRMSLVLLHTPPNIEPPAGQLRLASSSTTNFTANMIQAVSSMFPSKLFNTGGDEININCYVEDKSTQEDLGESCLV